MAAGSRELTHDDRPALEGGRPPVDLAHLRRYTMGDRRLETEILGLFADQLPITIAALRRATSQKEWGMAAHTLKGSARAVGAWLIATMGECAEQQKLPADAAEKERLIVSIEEAAATARAFIASLDQAA